MRAAEPTPQKLLTTLEVLMDLRTEMEHDSLASISSTRTDLVISAIDLVYEAVEEMLARRKRDA